MIKAMLKLLEDSEAIEAALCLLKERFMSAPFRTVSVTIPFYRRDLTVEARWFPDHRFWIAYDPDDRMMFGVWQRSFPNQARELPSPLNWPSLKEFTDTSQVLSLKMNMATCSWSTEVVSVAGSKELVGRPFFKDLVGQS